MCTGAPNTNHAASRHLELAYRGLCHVDRDMLELEFLREQRKMRIFTQRTSGPIENMIAYSVVLCHAAYAPSHARLGYNRL